MLSASTGFLAPSCMQDCTQSS